MLLETRFDTNDNIEIINGKRFSLGANLINFISLGMEKILNDKIISNLSENNYKKVISNIATASHGIEIIDVNNISSQNNIQEIKENLKLILDTYNNFRELIEFCYLNDNFKNITILQRFLYYLDKSKEEEVILPKQIISLKEKRTSNKHFKNKQKPLCKKRHRSFFIYNFHFSIFYSGKAKFNRCGNINHTIIK